MDHNEFCCIFDASQYTGVPDTAPCPQSVDVPALIRSLDALYAHGREAEAESFLEKALAPTGARRRRSLFSKRRLRMCAPWATGGESSVS